MKANIIVESLTSLADQTLKEKLTIFLSLAPPSCHSIGPTRRMFENLIVHCLGITSLL